LSDLSSRGPWQLSTCSLDRSSPLDSTSRIRELLLPTGHPNGICSTEGSHSSKRGQLQCFGIRRGSDPSFDAWPRHTQQKTGMVSPGHESRVNCHFLSPLAPRQLGSSIARHSAAHALLLTPLRSPGVIQPTRLQDSQGGSELLQTRIACSIAGGRAER